MPAVVRLLADDPLGRTREETDPGGDLEPYRRAFADIDVDPSQLLVVGETGGRVVATMQLTFIPGLGHRGARRAQFESIHVDATFRGRGLGRAMLEWAIGVSRARGCTLVQLTSDTSRAEAHRFYERLGFVASHHGYKMKVEPSDPH